MSYYEKRVIAFLDILGFKNLISETNNKKTFNLVKTSLEYIAGVRDEHYHGLFSEYKSIDKEISVFSDSIVISYSQNVRGGLFYILMDLVYICIYLNQNGIFVRGGITFGELYHKNHICFGPAMVAAYLLEEEKAIYPRIIVDNKAFEFGINTPGYANTPKQECEYLDTLLMKGDDGNFYLDYLSQAQEMDNPDYYIIVLLDIQKHIISNLKHTKEDKHIFCKYKWFKEYYNRTVKGLYKKEFIQENGLLIKNC